MIKKIVLDKADRLFHFPFDLEDSLPRRTIKSKDKRLPTIDLARLRWPIKDDFPGTAASDYRTATNEEISQLKRTVSEWLKKEVAIEVNPKREIYIGHGIHRMIFDFCHAYVEYGDIVLCPEPGIPFYRQFVISVGGVPVVYKPTRKNEYKPLFSKIPANLSSVAKVLIINNPSNPFGTMLDNVDLTELVKMASKQNLFIINDAAYYSIAEEKPVSIWSVPGGRKVGLELYSFPFTFGLPYHPFGFAIGPPEVIGGLETMGQTIGGWLPQSWVERAKNVIDNYPTSRLDALRKNIALSRLKAELMAEKLGWTIIGGKSCPFLWVRIPPRKIAASHATAIFRRHRILTMPGTAFGETGEGHLRLSLTAGSEEYDTALARISKKKTFGIGTEV